MIRLAFIFAVAATVACAQTNSTNSTGKELYMKFSCYACHGFSGQNGSGARLVPMKMTSDAFVAFVRKGRGQMPHYTAKVLPDDQLAEIYGYIKSLPDLTPPAKSIPALREILGQN